MLQGFANCSSDPGQAMFVRSKGTKVGKQCYDDFDLTNLCSGMANTIVYARYFVKELNKTAHLYKHVTDLPLAPLPSQRAGRLELVVSLFRSLPEIAKKILLANARSKYKALKRVYRSCQCAESTDFEDFDRYFVSESHVSRPD